jgi:hypothetical protein
MPQDNILHSQCREKLRWAPMSLQVPQNVEDFPCHLKGCHFVEKDFGPWSYFVFVPKANTFIILFVGLIFLTSSQNWVYCCSVSGYYTSSTFCLLHTTSRRLDSVSVFRWNLLSQAQSIQLVPNSGNQHQVKGTLRLTVSQSVSLGVKPHLGPMTRYLLLCDSYGLVLGGTLSDERTGLSFLCAAGPCQRSLFRVRVPWDLRPYFTVSDLRLPFSSPPTTRRVTVEVFDPASTRGTPAPTQDMMYKPRTA